MTAYDDRIRKLLADNSHVTTLIAKKTAIQKMFARHPVFKNINPFLSEYAAAFDQAIAPDFDCAALADDGTPLYKLNAEYRDCTVQHELMQLFCFSDKLFSNYTDALLDYAAAQKAEARLQKATPPPPNIDELGYAALVQYLKNNWTEEFYYDGSTPEECARINSHLWAAAYSWQRTQDLEAVYELDKFFAQVMHENQ